MLNVDPYHKKKQGVLSVRLLSNGHFMQPTRRSCSQSFKALVIQECVQPGASIVSIALSLNANLVHKWIRFHAQKSTVLTPAFIPKFFELHATNKNQIRPWALGRKNWLFAGSLHSGKRAAAIMSLIQLARLNGHDPYAYLKDVLTRLPTQRASDISQLLRHRWKPR